MFSRMRHPRTRSNLFKQAGAIVRQLHDAGYGLAPGNGWGRCLGVDAAAGTLMCTDAAVLPAQRQGHLTVGNDGVAGTDVSWVADRQELRFLRGYFRQSTWDDRERQMDQICPRTGLAEMGKAGSFMTQVLQPPGTAMPAPPHARFWHLLATLAARHMPIVRPRMTGARCRAAPIGPTTS